MKFLFFPTISAGDTKCLDFDGSTEAIAKNGTAIDIADTFTISMWVRFDNAPGTAETLLEFYDGTLPNTIVWRRDASGYSYIYLYNSAGDVPSFKEGYGDTATAASTWYMMSITFDGSTGGDPCILYVDDAAESETWVRDNAGARTNTSKNIWVGRDSGGSLPLDGRIYSVAIWNSVLTAAEIAAIYNSGDPSELDLEEDFGDYASSADIVHWWRLGMDSSAFADDTVGSIDLEDDSVDMTSADIVEDYPGA